MIRKGYKLFNIRGIANLIGKVLLMESAAMLISLLVCLLYCEPDWLAFLLSAGITGITGFFLGYIVKVKSLSLSQQDGILITALAWVVVAVFGALPFMVCTHPVNFTDALFESMSGFSTTGSSVISDVEALGKGVNMWRGLTQWIGGLGIVLFVLTLIPNLNKTGGMRLMAAESSDFTFDKTSPRITQTARSIALVYVILTLACILLLWAGPMDLYDSIVHSFATLSTGGFSPYSDGIMHFSSVYVKIVIIIFMLFGGTNFTLMANAGKGDMRSFFCNSTLHIFLLTVVTFTLLCIGSMAMQGMEFSIDGMVIDPLFTVVSAISSTGFASANYEGWGKLVFLFLLLLMYSGACIGSTSGGAKIDRVIVFFSNCRKEICSSINTKTLYVVSDGTKQVGAPAVGRIVTFMGLYALTLLIGSVLLMVSGIAMGDAFFAVFSCTSNIGLGYGITGFGGGYALLPEASKWVLTALMYVGRLELLTVFVLFLPSFWRR